MKKERTKEVVLYLVFGVLSTLVNIATFYVCDAWFSLGTIVSTGVAWLLSVVFAFVTNKLWVFESRGGTFLHVVFEALSFFAARLFSGGLDLLIMWTTVDLLHWNSMTMKILSNIMVVILNYIFSKVWIFRKPKKTEQEVRD